MKKGPPIIESITPTGITIGAKRVLPNVSAKIIKKAPNNPEHGINFLKSLPTISLLMWGAANPTKPIKPVKAITIDVIRAETMRIFLRILLGFTPVDIANSSPPIESVLRSQDHLSAVGSNDARIRPINITFPPLGLDRLPNDQCASWDN